MPQTRWGVSVIAIYWQRQGWLLIPPSHPPPPPSELWIRSMTVELIYTLLHNFQFKILLLIYGESLIRDLAQPLIYFTGHMALQGVLNKMKWMNEMKKYRINDLDRIDGKSTKVCTRAQNYFWCMFLLPTLQACGVCISAHCSLHLPSEENSS